MQTLVRGGEAIDVLERMPVDEMANYRTRQQIVADVLRRAILNGTLPPGRKLNQEDLAKRLGVSRMPIREALRVLTAEGLVEFNAHRGAVVANLSVNEIDDIFAVRIILESEAARRGAPRLSESGIAVMRQAFVTMNEPGIDPESWLACNETLHNTIYEATGLHRLCDLIASQRNSVRQYIHTASFLLGRRVESDHVDLLAACERRDGAAAGEITTLHLERTAVALKEALLAAGQKQAGLSEMLAEALDEHSDTPLSASSTGSS